MKNILKKYLLLNIYVSLHVEVSFPLIIPKPHNMCSTTVTQPPATLDTYQFKVQGGKNNPISVGGKLAWKLSAPPLFSTQARISVGPKP